MKVNDFRCPQCGGWFDGKECEACGYVEYRRNPAAPKKDTRKKKGEEK